MPRRSALLAQLAAVLAATLALAGAGPLEGGASGLANAASPGTGPSLALVALAAGLGVLLRLAADDRRGEDTEWIEIDLGDWD